MQQIRPQAPRKRLRIPLLLIGLAFVIGIAVVLIAGRDSHQPCTDNDYFSTCVERFGDPIITDASPTEGNLKGGDIEVTGKHFGPGVKVWIGDMPVKKVVVVNHVRLIATVPAVKVPQSYDVSVARGKGPKSILERGFRYETHLEIKSITPKTGPAAGGTTVTIKGNGFTDDTFVNFDGMINDLAHYVDEHTVTIVTRPHEPGTVLLNVSVGEDERVLENAFTYQ